MTFWHEVGAAAIGGVVAGFVTAGLALLFLDVPRGWRARKKRRETLLGVLQRQLVAAQGMRTEALRVLNDADFATAWPLFELYGAEILRVPDVPNVLSEDLLDEMLRVFNRMATANEVNELYRDLISGRTAALITATAGSSGDPEVAESILATISQGKAHYREGIRQRILELGPLLDRAVHGLEKLTGTRLDPEPFHADEIATASVSSSEPALAPPPES